MRPEELDSNVNLFRQYADEASETNPKLGAQFDKNSVITSIRTRTIHPEYCWLNLLEGTRPVGFISGALTQAPWNDEVLFAHIEMIYVLDSHRNINNFKQLLGGFEEWAKNMGASQLTAGDIGVNPKRSQTLYKSIGFEEGCFMTKEIAE